jgi:MerR family transcriptional regulator, light-induced transcriptional regulator
MFRFGIHNLNMNNFSISQLAHFSGIKAHTIRMWEQRYQALKPNRSEGNTRYYTSDQLRRLLNIVSLLDNGYKVSQLCVMPDDALFALLEEKLNNNGKNNTPGHYIAQLIAAGVGYNEERFQEVFSNSLKELGLKDTYEEVIAPMLQRIGLMWACNQLPPAQEHYMIHLLKQKLFSAIDVLPPAKNNTSTWLLYLAEDEFHEIGLLFANYYLKSKGFKVVYLGANVPEGSLQAALLETQAEHVLTFLVHNVWRC